MKYLIASLILFGLTSNTSFAIPEALTEQLEERESEKSKSPEAQKKADNALLKQLVIMQEAFEEALVKFKKSSQNAPEFIAKKLKKDALSLKKKYQKFRHDNAPEIRGMERRSQRKINDLIKEMKREMRKAKREMRKTVKELKRDLK